MVRFCCCPCAGEYEEHTYPSNFIYRNCVCLRYFLHQLFSGYGALFQRLDEQEVRSSIQEETSLATTELVSIPNTNPSLDNYQLVNRPTPYETDPRYSHLQREGLVLRHEKSLSHAQEKLEMLRRSNSSSSMENFGAGRKQNVVEYGERKTSHPDMDRASSAKSYGINFSTSTYEDEDVCPTCLEEYTEENPKIVTLCSHHFHLGCIYEWMERSDTCPVCGRAMEFCESP